MNPPGAWRLGARERAAALGLVALGALLALLAPGFFSPGNLRDVVLANAAVQVIAIGMTIVVLTGHIDVSVGAQFAIGAVAFAALARAGVPVPLAAAGATVAGALLGALNGWLVAWLRVPAIVATLATLVILRDALRWLTEGAWVTGLPRGFQWFGLGQAAGQGLVIGMTIALVAVAAWALRHLAAGRAVYAAGSDPEAARLAGLSPRSVVFGAFVVSGALTGMAAVLNAIRFAQVPSAVPVGLELAVIAAVVVGGAAITGGRGSMIGTVLGVALLGAIGTGLTFLGASAYWERALQGGIILAAILADAVVWRRRTRSRARSSPHVIDDGARPQLRTDHGASHEIRLAAVLAGEILVFAALAPGFSTAGNAAEIVRLAVEMGLLALVLTPIIVSGGIDLSVGALLGLSAVAFGALWRDAGWPIPLAALGALGLGTAGGGLNAWLIARWQLPPLIVTLGSLSLFRGLAEGLTGAVDSYAGFPDGFLAGGQGFFAGLVPLQAPLLAAAALGFGLLLHRSVAGRSWYAIGSSPAAARYAGVPVGRRLGELYLLAGATSAAAALVYVAHLGQAKADAGTGYELTAITAVVLGGTAITGGRGTVIGTLLGLAIMVVLQNGLRLAAWPAEFAGILTGLLLVGALGVPHVQAWLREAPLGGNGEEMRNSQLAVLCAVILLAAGLVAGSNWWLVRSLVPAAGAPAGGGAGTGPAISLGMMPKAKGDPYFVSCREGAERAAQELGVALVWDGPTDLDPAKQNEVVEAWITRGMDVVAVSVENRTAISTVLRKARRRGLKVLTWDADAEPDARDFLVNQATPQGIGYTLADEAARLLGGRGEIAIVTASLSAANQNEWIAHIRARMAERHPGLTLATIRPSDGDRDRAFAETQTILKVHPGVRLIMGIAAPAVPGIAEAVRQSGRSDVKVTGLSLPNMCKPYVHAGIIQSIVLWNTRDLGYLTVYAAHALATGALERGDRALDAGRLGQIEVAGDEILLGEPFVFTKDNIDGFDF